MVKQLLELPKHLTYGTYTPKSQTKSQSWLCSKCCKVMIEGTAYLIFIPTIPLQGGMSIGEYYITIGLGSNSQPLKVQVDTGSSSLIIPAASCTACIVNHNSFYDLTKSTSSSLMSCSSSSCSASCHSSAHFCGLSPSSPGYCDPSTNHCCAPLDHSSCGFFITYGDGATAQGSIVIDTITFPTATTTTSPTSIAFAQILTEKGNWPSTVDGILGMGYKILDCNPTCVTPVFDAISSIGGISDIFSLCMTNSNGYLVLGHIDTTLQTATPLYVPYSSLILPSYYGLSLLDMYIATESIFNVAGSTDSQRTNSQDLAIIDSGTTLLLLASNYYTAFKMYMQTTSPYSSLPGVAGGQIFSGQACLTAAPSSDWPVIQIIFEGVTLTIPPSLYFIKESSQGVYCLGIAEVPSGATLSIFGDVLMRGFHTIFDRTNSQIGFAPVSVYDCRNSAVDDGSVSGIVTANSVKPGDTPNGGFTPEQWNAMLPYIVGVGVFCSLLICSALYSMIKYYNKRNSIRQDQYLLINEGP